MRHGSDEGRQPVRSWRDDPVAIDQLARFDYSPTFQDPRDLGADIRPSELQAWYADVKRQLQANASFSATIANVGDAAGNDNWKGSTTGAPDPAMAVANKQLNDLRSAIEAFAVSHGITLG